MSEFFSNITNIIFCLIALVIFMGITFRLLKDGFSNTKEVSAVVLDKRYCEKTVYSKNGAAYPKKQYIITFLCGNKKQSFEVSEFSYDGYHINEKGTLKYKGSKLIDFKN